jgi:hypothetical protein
MRNSHGQGPVHLEYMVSQLEFQTTAKMTEFRIQISEYSGLF